MSCPTEQYLSGRSGALVPIFPTLPSHTVPVLFTPPQLPFIEILSLSTTIYPLYRILCMISLLIGCSFPHTMSADSKEHSLQISLLWSNSLVCWSDVRRLIRHQVVCS